MIFNLIKNYVYAHVVVPYLHYKYGKQLNIKNSQETLDYILEHKCSVSRFGDYEYMSIYEETNNFQTSNSHAAARLKEVLNSNIPNHIACIPYSFRSISHDNEHAQIFWKHYIAKYGKRILEVTDTDKDFFDASFTRFYMDLKDKSFVHDYVEKMKLLWKNRDVYIVEGTGTCFGVNDDFLDGARTIHRIICPATNAFDKYEQIIEVCKKNIPQEALVLCALGMTATILAYDLAKEGYQAIDIGHADVEYVWFKMGVDHKVPISGKNVNEVGINNETSTNLKYLNEIVCRI